MHSKLEYIRPYIFGTFQNESTFLIGQLTPKREKQPNVPYLMFGHLYNLKDAKQLFGRFLFPKKGKTDENPIP